MKHNPCQAFLPKSYLSATLVEEENSPGEVNLRCATNLFPKIKDHVILWQSSQLVPVFSFKNPSHLNKLNQACPLIQTNSSSLWCNSGTRLEKSMGLNKVSHKATHVGAAMLLSKHTPFSEKEPSVVSRNSLSHMRSNKAARRLLKIL